MSCQLLCIFTSSMTNQLQGVRKQLAPLASGMSMPQLLGMGGPPLLVPLYHLVTDAEVPHVSPLYAARRVTDFKNDLAFLLKHFKAIGLHELGGVILPSFHLTFDDGLKEVYTVAFPIMQELGLTATLFLNPDFLDNKKLFYRHQAALLLQKLKEGGVSSGQLKKLEDISIQNTGIDLFIMNATYEQQDLLQEIAQILEVDFDAYLEEKQPYMTTKQVEEMLAAGFTIGAHSMDHPLYKHLSLEEQLNQTRESINWLQERFNVPVRSFAFPFTDDGVGSAFFNQLYQDDKTLQTFGTAGLKHEAWPQHTHRVPMEIGEVPGERIVKTEYLYYLLKQPLGKNRITRS